MSNCKVFKFGGASIKDAEGIRNITAILEGYRGNKIVVVISAMAKITNALENVVDSFYNGQDDKFELLASIRNFHFNEIDKLFTDSSEVKSAINDLLVEIEWLIEDEIHDSYEYIYDQIASVGELVSSKLVANYLLSQGHSCRWMDARDMIITDDNYKNARVEWGETERRIQQKMVPQFDDIDFIITQGFIASTDDNQTTTLAREGSDYSASIFSYCLNAEEMVIWKDVPGVMSGDPKKIPDAVLLDNLSFEEAIEMTYYGAKVIHAKTIKPIENKGIPLFVKSFMDPSSIGTKIFTKTGIDYPPIKVIEENQCLMQVGTMDFSFVAENHIGRIFQVLDKYRVKVNLMRNSAINFMLCINDSPRQIERIKSELQDEFVLNFTHKLTLETIRHYREEDVKIAKENHQILWEERLKNTIQLIY